jgi:hypothetical protein
MGAHTISRLMPGWFSIRFAGSCRCCGKAPRPRSEKLASAQRNSLSWIDLRRQRGRFRWAIWPSEPGRTRARFRPLSTDCRMRGWLRGPALETMPGGLSFYRPPARSNSFAKRPRPRRIGSSRPSARCRRVTGSNWHNCWLASPVRWRATARRRCSSKTRTTPGAPAAPALERKILTNAHCA